MGHQLWAFTLMHPLAYFASRTCKCSEGLYCEDHYCEQGIMCAIRRVAMISAPVGSAPTISATRRYLFLVKRVRGSQSHYLLTHINSDQIIPVSKPGTWRCALHTPMQLMTCHLMNVLYPSRSLPNSMIFSLSVSPFLPAFDSVPI